MVRIRPGPPLSLSQFSTDKLYIYDANIKEGTMPKYLFQGSYTQDGINGLLAVGGSHRAEAVKQLIESVGGSLEAFYYAFGEDDIIVIAELPDEVTATALSLKVSAGGTATFRTTRLLEPDLIDAAMKVDVDYTPAKA